MKILDRFMIIVFVLCLTFSSIICPVILISSNGTYYISQLKKQTYYNDSDQTITIHYVNGDPDKTAVFSNEQTNVIVSHITDFISGKKETFDLRLNDVILNGEKTDNVKIFSDAAIEHMEQVKSLYANIKIIALILIIVMTLCIIYMIKCKSHVSLYIYKWSLSAVLSLFIIAFIFLLAVLIKTFKGATVISANTYFNELWYYMHYIFFPFDSVNFNGSFFNDTLTELLSTDFFMNAVFNTVLTLITITFIWLFCTKIIYKKTTLQIKNPQNK